MGKKIAVVNPNLDDSIGGGEAVSLSLLNILSDDYDVDYYTKNADDISDIGKKFEYDIPESADILKLEEAHFSKILSSIGSFTLVRKAINDRKIVKEFEKTEYDKIVFTAEILGSDKLSKKSMQYVHSGPPNEEDYSGPMKLYLKACQFFRSIELLDTNLVIFNSENLKKKWESDGEVIYPPIKGLDKSDKFDKEAKAIAIGRISPDKNFEEAIGIAKKSGIKLTIAGFKQDESYFNKLKQQEDNNIEVRHDLSSDELKKLLGKAKIGLLSRRNEPFGMVVVEYMKAGVLPMVRNEGGPKEIVPGSEFTYDSVEEASEKIQSNLENFEELQEKVKERSKDFSEKKFRQEIEKEIKQIL